MDQLVELRCKYCGAPLDREQIESDSPYVTCQCCGTSQQRVDAKAYMQQMMGQIQSWISKAIPGGFSLAQQENVDPIARHNIYITNVKPSIELEIRDYRFALNSVVSSPLIVLPFTKGEPAKSKHSSSNVFEFNAKLKSIEPLAVDVNDRAAITEAENMTMAYALIVNNSQLLTDTTPGRFALMSKNFKESAEAIGKCKDYEPLVGRLNALSEVCTASDMVLNGDHLGCVTKAETAIGMLQKAKSEILRNPKLAMRIRAVDLEIGQSKTLKSVAEMSVTGTNGDALGTLEVMNKLGSLNYPSDQSWNPLLRKKDRDYELFSYVEGIVTARSEGTLPICPGDGDILYPFWDVDLKYNFTTGSLFSKKVVEVTEDILIPATFTLSAEALRNPRRGLTDIFSVVPESSIMDRIKGEQDSISGGAGIGRLTDSATDNRPGTRSIVLPLSTKTEATRLVEEYLRQSCSSNSKLKLSKPYVKRLIYVPCRMGVDGITLPSAFDRLTPAVLSDPALNSIIKI